MNPDLPLVKGSDVYEQVKSRVERTIRFGPQIEIPFRQAERFLRRHVNERLRMAILIADIAGSTRLSLELPTRVLANLIQIFSQEVTLLITSYNGYVLKYVGDAVVSFFPAEYDVTSACTTAVKCAVNVFNVINNAVNPIINDVGYPSINTKIGIDFGQNLIMIYGKSVESSYIDIIGSAVSMASKIASVANTGQLLIGQDTYIMLDKEMQKRFIEFNISSYRWSFIDPITNDPYKLYLYSMSG